MRRSVLKVICIISGILFVVLSISAVVSVVQVLAAAGDAGGTGIIGGADAPTLEYILQTAAKSPAFYAAIAFLFLCAGTGLALILRRKPK